MLQVFNITKEKNKYLQYSLSSVLFYWIKQNESKYNQENKCFLILKLIDDINKCNEHGSKMIYNIMGLMQKFGWMQHHFQK